MEQPKVEVQKKSKKRMLLVLAFLIIYILYCYISFRGKYLSILEIGEQYTDIFMKTIYYKAICSVINFIVIFFTMYIATNITKKGLKKFFDEEKKPFPKLPNKSIAFIVSIIATMFISEILTQKVMLLFNYTWFGETDPIFHMDIGYYMFQKPFIEFVLIYIIALIVAVTVYVAVYYIIAFNKYFEDGINPETLKKSLLIKQLMANIMILAVAIASLVIVKTYDILYGSILDLANSEKTTLLGARIVRCYNKIMGI